MARPSRLTRPPIKEALIDLRTPEFGLDPQVLEPLWPQVKDRYPNLEVRNKVEAQLKASPGVPPSAQAQDLGFYALFLKTANNSHVAQFRSNGFTLSQLTGYTSADDVFTEAFDLWHRFSQLSRPNQVNRIALRYINSLALPFGQGESFERFLAAPIRTPDEAQIVSEFFTRTVLPIDPVSQIVGIVTQRLGPTFQVGTPTPYTLDVDVFQTGEFSTEKEVLLPVLRALRQIKNDLFFSYLTDEALEPYR